MATKIYSQLFYKKSLVSVGKIQDDIKKQYGEYSMLAVHYIWEDIFGEERTKKLIGLKKKSDFDFSFLSLPAKKIRRSPRGFLPRPLLRVDKMQKTN